MFFQASGFVFRRLHGPWANSRRLHGSKRWTRHAGSSCVSKCVASADVDCVEALVWVWRRSAGLEAWPPRGNSWRVSWVWKQMLFLLAFLRPGVRDARSSQPEHSTPKHKPRVQPNPLSPEPSTVKTHPPLDQIQATRQRSVRTVARTPLLKKRTAELA